VASSFSATAASHRTVSPPLLPSRRCCVHRSPAAGEKQFLPSPICGGRKALLRREVLAKGEEGGSEAREAVAMVLLSTGAIVRQKKKKK